MKRTERDPVPLFEPAWGRGRCTQRPSRLVLRSAPPNQWRWVLGLFLATASIRIATATAGMVSFTSLLFYLRIIGSKQMGPLAFGGFIGTNTTSGFKIRFPSPGNC